jgi:hypothetical protein
MSEPITKVGMTPCHPGEFIREEVLHALHLPVARAAEILGVRRRPCPICSTARPPCPRRWRCASRRRLACPWTRCCACRRGTPRHVPARREKARIQAFGLRPVLPEFIPEATDRPFWQLAYSFVRREVLHGDSRSQKLLTSARSRSRLLSNHFSVNHNPL